MEKTSCIQGKDVTVDLTHEWALEEGWVTSETWHKGPFLVTTRIKWSNTGNQGIHLSEKEILPKRESIMFFTSTNPDGILDWKFQSFKKYFFVFFSWYSFFMLSSPK